MLAGRLTVTTRRFEVVEVPTPDAGPGEVRIAVAAGSACRTSI
jgi:NADPH:quinone reductase-like Zn-dependent oxidoreductase